MKRSLFLFILLLTPAAWAAAPNAPDKPSVASSTASAIPANWKELKSDYGWRIRFPADWDVYVYAENNMEPTPEEGKGVNFSGPKDCYRTGRTCGMVRMALRLDEDQEEFVPPAGAVARKFGGAEGYEMGENVWAFVYDEDVWMLKLDISGTPRADADQVRHVMELMRDSVSFDVPWTPGDVAE